MHPLAHLRDEDVVLDALPADVTAALEVRDRFMNALSLGGGLAVEFVVSDLQRWLPGQAVRVAFLDGGAELHRKIMEATREITDCCNLRLDFGETAEGTFRRWTEKDGDYAAEIRVSFDKDGYFSLVGTDSVDPTLGAPGGKVGGRPYQASLNLGGYAERLPPRWEGTVRHEFLHALGFHHAHQNMRGPCQASFRWEDDEGYEPTRNEAGAYVPDAQGRRPGIYTYLAGYPNFWDRAKVDHNLKTEEDPHVVTGPFDPFSVMLYRFPPDFYRSLPSPCAPRGEGVSLSDGDRRGLQLLYPPTAGAAEVVAAQQRILTEMTRLGGAGGALPESAVEALPQLPAVAGVMQRKLAALR